MRLRRRGRPPVAGDGSGTELELAAVVVTVACQGCGACLLTCPEQAIRPVPDRGSNAPLTVLPGRCSGCGECVEICPADAIFLAEEAMTW